MGLAGIEPTSEDFQKHHIDIFKESPASPFKLQTLLGRGDSNSPHYDSESYSLPIEIRPFNFTEIERIELPF